MNKIIFTFAIMLLGVGGVYAKPAVKAVMRVTQPDGSTLSIVKRGDERCHNVFTADGKLILKNEEGAYEYASVDKDGELAASGIMARDAASRSEADKAFLSGLSQSGITQALSVKQSRALESGKYSLNIRGVGDSRLQTRGPGLFSYDFPVSGEQKGLVILVEFSDVKFNSKNKAPYNTTDPYKYFHDMLNKEGFDTYGGTGSAKDWFVLNSNGKFVPEFDVFGPVTLSNTMKYYGQNSRFTDEDMRPGQMVVDACKALDSEIDFKEYDRNNDGYVDNVYIFYAGYGEADTDESDAIWPHSWALSEAVGSPLQLDGVYIDSYGCSSETCGYNEYGVLARRPDGVGTFVHEFSHVMGLPDLYSTASATSYRTEPFTPGEFSVMDYGPYNNDGLTPPNYSAYERYAFDWLTPEEMVAGTLSLENLADSNKAYIVKTEKEREYYLFENRQQTGWDKYIPGHGMLVWHIDFDPVIFMNNEVNNSKSHQYVDLVEADNIQDYPTGQNSYGYFIYPASTQSGDPFPGTKKVTSFGSSTTPALKSWAGNPLAVSLTDITEKSGVISFVAENNGNGSGIKDVSGEVELTGDLYDLNGKRICEVKGVLPQNVAPGIYILRTTDGRSVKILK